MVSINYLSVQLSIYLTIYVYLDAVLCDNDNVLSTPGMVAACVIDVQQVVLAVNHPNKEGGLVLLQVELTVWRRGHVNTGVKLSSAKRNSTVLLI